MVKVKINKFYFKFKNGQSYYLPLYSTVSGCFFGLLILTFMGYFMFGDHIWIMFQFILVVFYVCYLISLFVSHNGFFNYFRVNQIKRLIIANWLKIKGTGAQYVQVPFIDVIYNDDATLLIRINKVVGLLDSELDSIRQLVNSSLVGKWKNYAVTSQRIADNGLYFSFIAKNVGINQAFIPNCEKDLVQNAYFVKLQNNLTINLAKSPHIAIWGATGTGKTTVLFSIIAQCLSNGTTLLFLDGKDEFSSLSSFYPRNRIVSNNSAVLRLLAKICDDVLPRRQKFVANEVQQKQQLGLTGYDLGLRPIVIIVDEVGSIVASMTSREKKLLIAYLTQIIQKGRSVSVFLVVATQSPAVDVLPQAIRTQFSTKILLGSTNGDNQRMALGQSVGSGCVGKFTGYYVCDGITIVPQRFWVPNLIKNDLQKLDVLKKLYNWSASYSNKKH